MESIDTHELLIQARQFSSDFDEVVQSLHRRLLPIAKQGVPQQPISYVYWYKESGYQNTAMWPDDADDPDPKNQLYLGEWCYLKSHPNVIRSEAYYSERCQVLRNNRFETTLKRFADYKEFKFATAQQRVSLHDDLKGSHDNTVLLRMACLRVLTGGIDLYLDPLNINVPQFSHPSELDDDYKDPTKIAVEAKLGTLAYPSDKTVSAAKRLIRNIKSAAKRLIRNIKEDGGAVVPSLEQTAKGEPYRAAKRTVPVKAMVREMSLLSKLLLNTTNGNKGRFPPSAIQHALSIMDDQTSKTQISKYQALYDDTKEVPLSNINRNLVTRAHLSV
jgi:hypothetical protein